MKRKISFDFPHGKIEGIYLKAKVPGAALVIITNGQNGFYNYGMFPYIQEKLCARGISSYSYNFSHGGIVGDADYFSELDLYEKNCMRLETEDLCEIVRTIKNSDIDFSEKTKLIFFTHSLGSIPTIFASKKLLSEGYKIDGIILVSPVKTLDRWPKDIIREWEKTGVRLIKNNRTKQELPQGKELLEEAKKANGEWNLKAALKEVDSDFLIIHGDADEAVSMKDAYSINDWLGDYGLKKELKIIPNAGHTFGTKHPFAGTSKELEQLIKETIDWIG